MLERSWLTVGAAAMCALSSACSRSPDVVAQTNSEGSGGGRDAGTLSPGDPLSECKVGSYDGVVLSRPPGDGGATYPLSGKIHFKLVQSQSGEFQTIQNMDGLSGMSDDGKSTFKADIPNGRCLSGNFDTTLENGMFVSSDLGVTFTFEGAIHGNYDSRSNSFQGNWRSVSYYMGNPTLHVSGVWWAYNTGNM